MTTSEKNERAVFPQGAQRAFLESVQQRISVKKMASLCGCTERTIRDWRREKHSMTAGALFLLSEHSGIPIPTTVRFVPAYAHTSEAAKKGGKAVIEKYGKVPGDPAYRVKQWRKWWEEEGKYSGRFPNAPLPIYRPPKSKKLAEMIGILMGDGGLSTYQAVVSLHTVDDAEYIHYVAAMMQGLFKIVPSIYPSKSANVTDIVISRSLLVNYLHELGLPKGNKIRQGLDMPAWILEKPSYALACVRGLVDTDGCIFTHRYVVKGKKYEYKKLSFTSASPILLRTVQDLLKSWGMHPRLTRTRDVRLDSVADMERYFSLVGSHNPKHLRRYGI